MPVIENAWQDATRFKKPGLTAILVYPMNALANDQELRINQYLDESGLAGAISVAKYDRGTSQTEREQLRKNPPHILLTNYMMLEYLLVRPADREAIFANHRCRFLVLDEVHTYRGILGSNIALLVRRLRVHLARARQDWKPDVLGRGAGQALSRAGPGGHVGHDQDGGRGRAFPRGAYPPAGSGGAGVLRDTRRRGAGHDPRVRRGTARHRDSGRSQLPHEAWKRGYRRARCIQAGGRPAGPLPLGRTACRHAHRRSRPKLPAAVGPEPLADRPADVHQPDRRPDEGGGAGAKARRRTSSS